MKFRIKEFRGITYGLVKPFQIQYAETWFDRDWRYYRRREYPYHDAEFDTLEEARAFIRKEKEFLDDKKKQDKEERKRTTPIYHSP